MNKESKVAHRKTETQFGLPEIGESLATETDLASRWLGGSVMAANDESFGEKENLLTPGTAAFEPGRYSHRGEIVDGWETRRRREPGHDWALIRLGSPGVVSSVDVDTSFFTGNFPVSCQIEACGWQGYPGPEQLLGPESEWFELVPQSLLKGDTHNLFAVHDWRRFTHVRLSIFPDGGVARLRVLGDVVPDPRDFDRMTIDLASQEHGGVVISSSDGFYTSAQSLNRPDRARTMGEGWETRRRRDGGHDHAVIRLASAGHIRLVEVDTAHFKYNASAEIAVYGSVVESSPPSENSEWVPLVRRTGLQADTRHVFAMANDGRAVSSIRIDAFPDGGISRVRAYGAIEPAARRQAGYRWFNSLPQKQAVQVLVDSALPSDVAIEITGERPLREGWLQQDFNGLSTVKTAEGRAEEYRLMLGAILDGKLERELINSAASALAQ